MVVVDLTSADAFKSISTIKAFPLLLANNTGV